MRAKLLAIGLLVVPLFAPGSASAQEKVRFSWRPGWIDQFDDSHSGGEIEARLFRPAVSGEAPYVVFMHGCGGLALERVSHWAKFYNQRRVGFLMVDSLATRKVEKPCLSPPPGWIRRRADDAASALEWLSAQPYVKTDRIAIMGQSQGGASTLLALHEGTAGARGFVGGIAMYPGCARANNNKVRLAKPVLVLIGSEDAATPPADCRLFRPLRLIKASSI
jgi:predicted peptidase